MSYVRVSTIEKELSVSDISNIVQNAQLALQNAITSVGKQPNAYVTRDLLPVEDFAMPSESWSFTYNTTGYNTIINTTLPDDKFIVIYGVELQSPNPITGAVKFYRNVDPLFVAQLSKAYTYETPVLYFNPIVWSQNQVLQILAYANATGTDYVAFRGIVAELCGKVISCKK